jgi:uncharacterized protein
MNLELERLIRLQGAESELSRVEAELAEIPRSKARVEEELDGDRGRLEAARQGLATSQKTRRQLEGELQDLESRRSKYKGQLMEVKTNKEYTAMLHEIEAVEREIRAREDAVLEEMEKSETLAEELAREEVLFRQAEVRTAGELKTLDERARALEAEKARKAEERGRIASTLSEESLHLFQRVAKLRGTAVAEARDGMCQVCHMKLRLQMYADIKHNEEITQCPACNRILYFEPPAPTVSPEP